MEYFVCRMNCPDGSASWTNTFGRGAAKDRGFWLQAFNGGPYTVNRISRGSILIENLSVSLLGGINLSRSALWRQRLTTMACCSGYFLSFSGRLVRVWISRCQMLPQHTTRWLPA